MEKTTEFWRAWQDTLKSFAPAQTTDPMQAWWQQQEQFWKKTMEQGSSFTGQQPDMAKQWQEMQASFMQKWLEMAQAAAPKQSNGMLDNTTGMWKSFAEQSEKWFTDAFRQKLPEPLRPHFQTYTNMQRMFSSQWENIQGMIKNGLTEPKYVWQWINPAQYGETVSRVMGFKPMTDLEEAIRNANAHFDKMRSMVMNFMPSSEEKMLEIGEAVKTWSDKQTGQAFPLFQSMHEMVNNTMDPFMQISGQDDQSDVLRRLKDLHFAYVAYLHNSHNLQKMVMDAGAMVLPQLLKEAREQYESKHEMPEFDPFLQNYMNRLEHAILDVMHTDAYAKLQNDVLSAGSSAKSIYNDIMEVVLKDWPFMTKREADELVKDTTDLRRKLRALEAKVNGMHPVNGKATPIQVKETKAAAAPTATAKVAPKAKATSKDSALITLIGKAEAGVEADDLKKIKGVGAKLEQMLFDIGVTTYTQVSKMNDKAYTLVDDLIPAFKGRAKRDEWARQALDLMAQTTLA